MKNLSNPIRISALALACLMAGGAALAQEIQTDFEYDAAGNPTKITDGLKRSTQMKYDPLKRIKQITQPAPAVGVARPTIGFTFDALDQLQTVTDPRNLTTRYTVDGLGKQTVLNSPDTGQTNATYNSLGYISTSTDARGVITKYDYDLNNRLTSITYGSVPYRFGYDEGQYGAGHLTSMTYPAGRTDFTWDQLGRLRSKTQTTKLGLITRTFAFSYTYGKSGYANGELVSMTYPSGNRLEYTYGLPGKITAITLKPANNGTPVSLLRDIKYRPFGPAQSWTWGNSTDTQQNTYAKSFDLSSRVTSFPLGNAFNQGMMRAITYDDANRITNIVDTGIMAPKQTTQSYGYDDLDRLTSYKEGSNVYGYQYDANGNRTQVSINGAATTFGISPTSNRITSFTPEGKPVNVQADAAGNLTSAPNYSSPVFQYGPTGRIETVMGGYPQRSVSYFYNSIGERLNTANSHYVFDENGQQVGEYALDGTPMEETVFLGNQPVAVLKSVPPQATSVYYVYADHLNTPRLITRAIDDKIVWRWEVAEPFGASLPAENPSGLGQFVYNRRFPGQVFDEFLGVNYNYYRDYDSLSGRYLSSDPIGLSGGVNTYSYVLGNPLSNFDPLGLETICVPGPIMVCRSSGPMGLPSSGIPNSSQSGDPRESDDGGRWQPIPDGPLRPSREGREQRPLSMSNSSNKTQAPATQRAAEYLRYKDICNQPTPPGLNKCDEAKWKKNRAQQCYNARDEFTNKWYGGNADPGHANQMAELQKAIQNADRDVRRFCKCP